MRATFKDLMLLDLVIWELSIMMMFIYFKNLQTEYYQVNSTLPRVDIVKCHIDSDGVMLDALANAGSEGIIIEGVGRGQVAPP